MKAKVTLVREGIGSKTVEFENGATVREVMEAANELGWGEVGINGIPADADSIVEDGDVVTESKTPEGGF